MHPYTHVRTEDGRESLTIFTPSGSPIVATGDHPQFAELLEGAQSNASIDDLRGLADLSNAVAQRFDTLSERVAVAHGRVFFDGDEVDSTITQQIVRCLDDPSVGDWKPLVLFMENVAANPNEHSREQLFEWLRDREFTITSNGWFIAYKGVYDRDEDDGYPYQSSSRGEAIVNGERYTGAIPNGVGATVEMPRGEVQHNPAAGCSTGLHVGTYKYAQGYAKGALLTVFVNPRDVVSVPTDCSAEKMRVCRYVVSDDEPTPPSESAAIVYEDEDVDGPETYEKDGDKYAVIERRPAKQGETFWNDLYDAVEVANWDFTEDVNILTRVYTELLGSAEHYDGHEYFILTGEERPARKGEFYTPADGQIYAGKVCRAAFTHGSPAEKILVPLS